MRNQDEILRDIKIILIREGKIELSDLLSDIIENLKNHNDTLVKRSIWLECLEEAGVDGWGGIDVAYDMLEGCENDA